MTFLIWLNTVIFIEVINEFKVNEYKVNEDMSLVAQLLEYWIHNWEVVGSNPVSAIVSILQAQQ